MNRYAGCTTSDAPLGDLGRLCHLISKVGRKKCLQFLGDEKLKKREIGQPDNVDAWSDPQHLQDEEPKSIYQSVKNSKRKATAET